MGCGTFDPESRARMKEVERERTTEEMRRRIKRLEVDVPDPVERFVRRHEILGPTYLFDPIDEEEDVDGPAPFDKPAHQETWDDMMRLQREGVYPAAFTAIRSPVLMLHGAYDPHPGGMIRESLRPHIPQLEYREWKECGHYLWRERRVTDAVFAVTREWIARKLANERDREKGAR
jgi:pimeloyl-ACP methyl ester carboxylesterase